MSKFLPSEIGEDESDNLQQRGLNFSPFLRTVKRKALLIGVVTALATGFYVYRNYKQNSALYYAGSFQLLTEPITLEAKSSDPNTLVNPNEILNARISAVDYSTIDYPTMLQILRSPDILYKIVERVKTKYPEFSISQLSQNLQVERINNSDNRLDASKILAISYIDGDPKLVQLVLEATAQEYLDYSLNSRKQGIDKGIQFIERQMPQLNQKVSQNLDEIQQLQERYQIVQADKKGESLQENVREAESEQRETQKEIEEQTQIVKNLESQLKISTEEALTIAALRENPNFQSLFERYKEKESELAIAEVKFRVNSPQVINLREEKQKIRNLLDAETREVLIDKKLSQRANRLLILEARDSILSDLLSQLVEATNELDVLQARQRVIAKNLSQFQEEAQAFPEISRKYQYLQQELEIANRTKEQLSIQKDRLQIQASQTETPWEVVSQPQVMQDSNGNPQPLPTDFPSSVLKGLLGGLFLGITTAILIEKIRGLFYSFEDVTDIAESSILGEIPFRKGLSSEGIWNCSMQRLLNGEKLNGEKIDVDKPPAHQNTIKKNYDEIEFVSAFEQLYASIYLRYRDKSIKSIAVSSPSFQDGKSTVALYLAKAIAADNKQVLLVDTNLFSYQLADNSNMIFEMEPNLHVFVPSPDTISNSSLRAKLMSDFGNEYEHVIYDMPSILDSPTAGFVSINTDGILLVTAIEKTKKSTFAKTLEHIEALNLPLLGIVVNHVGGEQLQIEKSSSDRSKNTKTNFLANESKMSKGQGINFNSR